MMSLFRMMRRFSGDARAADAGHAGSPDAGGGDRRFTIVNHGAGEIGAIHVKPAGGRRRGADLLAGRTLGAGERNKIAPQQAAGVQRFDIWIEYRSGAGHYLRAMNLATRPGLGVTEFGIRPI